MKVLKVRWLASGLVALALDFSASSASARPIAPRETVNVKGKKLATLTFTNLVLRGEMFEDVGVAKDEFILMFLEELRQQGYPVRGAENLVFDKDKSADAQFQLGGTLTQVLCDEKGSVCGVSVTWELMDRRTETVVYKVQTHNEEEADRGVTQRQFARDLLRGALRALLARPRFAEALTQRPDTTSGGPRYQPKSIQRCATPAAALPASSEQVLEASVVVTAGDRIGSGVLVSPDGLVLTAAHVVEDRDVQVRLRDGTTQPGRTVRLDAKHDVALVQLRTKQTSCLPLRPDSPAVGEEIYAVGSPAGEALSFSVSRGIVSGKRQLDGVELLQTDASISPGNSGGPLVDAQGRTVAIVSFKLLGPGLDGLGFGVPVSSALERLSLTLGEHTDEALGAELAPAPSSAPRTFEDVPDTSWNRVDRPKPELAGWVKPVRTASWVVAGTGAAIALYSWSRYAGSHPLSHDTYESMRPVNDVGWVLFGLGAVGITASYLFSTTKEAEGKPGVKVSAALGPGAATFKVVY
jgi:serine protease Do